MRRALDLLYAAGLWLSALCILVIASLVGLQVVARIWDAILQALDLPRSGFVVLSLAEISGYLFAAASFLALAGTLKSGAHIRVTMLVNALPQRVRALIEAAALAFGALAAGFGTWAIGGYALESWRFGEVSPGLVQVPLVWPQAAMAAGAALLTIAFLDELTITVRTGRPSFRAAEDAVALGREG
ncbi:TRAP transporter small permease [Salinarimonas ramus]|uniref:TRAP transporter small permease protein n=1 Tax=Salinarimonas ramus TaxID=690164 RepID=A0A917Q5S0_9HYPH|nr:TRAP transporter small permease subunit [Salinarimonas ramus]GGK27373.1 membrane protein [Salinarimonas ramus]